MTMNKYFVLHPGTEQSISDGQMHLIDVKQLCQLYHIDLRECYVVDYRKPETYKGLDLSDKSRLIHLYPRRFRDEYERMAKMIDVMRTVRSFNK